MRIRSILLAPICLAVALSLSPPELQGADHLDAPLVTVDGRLDINDLYVFQSPANSNNTVLVMTVNPVAGVLSPTTFDPQGDYEFLVDTNGDALQDITFRVTFSLPENTGAQRVLVRRNNVVIARGASDTDIPIRAAGGGMARAGVFDDPFFFDLNGFNNGFQFTGDDFFAGLNVSAIVLEIPSTTLGSTNVGVWARTTIRKQSERRVRKTRRDRTEGIQRSIKSLKIQVDRMGRPAINTVLIPSELKDSFNQGRPADDVRDFLDPVVATITALSGDASYAEALAAVLLPDILTVDTSDAGGFLNGRRLADDVIDAELDLLTMGALLGDDVDANDVPFLDVFPYLAPPHP